MGVLTCGAGFGCSGWAVMGSGRGQSVVLCWKRPFLCFDLGHYARKHSSHYSTSSGWPRTSGRRDETAVSARRGGYQISVPVQRRQRMRRLNTALVVRFVPLFVPLFSQVPSHTASVRPFSPARPGFDPQGRREYKAIPTMPVVSPATLLELLPPPPPQSPPPHSLHSPPFRPSSPRNL